MNNFKLCAFILCLTGLLLPCFAYGVNYEHYGQGSYISQKCPRGNEKAKKLTQQGGDYAWGRNGMVSSDEWAAEKYEKAIKLGDIAAANNLGQLHFIGIPGYLRGSERAINRFAVLMFNESIAMGAQKATKT